MKGFGCGVLFGTSSAEGLVFSDDFRSASLSDNFKRAISAWARAGFGFSLGLVALEPLVLGFIKPFLEARSSTSCADSTGFCKNQTRRTRHCCKANTNSNFNLARSDSFLTVWQLHSVCVLNWILHFKSKFYSCLQNACCRNRYCLWWPMFT